MTHGYHLPYSTGELEFTLPDGMQADAAVSKPVPPLADPSAAIRAVWREPK
jgi:hypothetical protein